MIRSLAAALLFATMFAIPSHAQSTPSSSDISFLRTFLVKNASGTAANPGASPRNAILYDRGSWRFFREDMVFVTYATQTGPAQKDSAFFSTNWLAAGAQHNLGDRGFILFRARVSAEPVTVPSQGYPMLLHSVPGADADHQPGHDALGEIAAHAAFRLGATSFVHLYVAPVGDPAFGAVPFAQRASSREFAAAPFSYGVQELAHHQSSVVTAGFANQLFSIEGSTFHEAPAESGESSIHLGSLDTSAARLTITPTQNWSGQISTLRARRGGNKQDSASVSYGRSWNRSAIDVSAIWSRDAIDNDATLIEATWRVSNNYFLARFESVKQSTTVSIGNRKSGTGQLGYTRDVYARPGSRIGVGALLDYHTQTRDLKATYGHKPQDFYLFLRMRTGPQAR